MGKKKCGHFTLFSKYLENRSKIVRYNLQFFYTHLLHIQLWKSLIISRFVAPRQFFLRVQKIPNNSSSWNTTRDKSTITRIFSPEHLAPPRKQHKWINTWLKNKKNLRGGKLKFLFKAYIGVKLIEIRSSFLHLFRVKYFTESVSL